VSDLEDLAATTRIVRQSVERLSQETFHDPFMLADRTGYRGALYAASRSLLETEAALSDAIHCTRFVPDARPE
jgi:hypothetical protein